jgi:predicted porin
MNKIKKMLISAIAIVGLTTSVSAFEGFSIGASYSSTDFSTSGTETTVGAGADPTSNTSTAITKTGSADIGSIFAEYTFSQGSTIGIDYIDGTAEIGKASRTSNVPAGTVTASASISDPLTLYVEPTYMFNEKFGVYVKGGLTELTVTPKEVDSASVTASTYKAKDLYGKMTGMGAKYYMGNFFVKAEYTETDFATYTHTSTTGDKNTISADIDLEETRFALGYNF